MIIFVLELILRNEGKKDFRHFLPDFVSRKILFESFEIFFVI